VSGAPDTIPPLDNGLPRAMLVQPEDGGPAVSVVLTEDMPVEIMLVDSGLAFMVETRGDKLWITARRDRTAPTVEVFGG